MATLGIITSDGISKSIDAANGDGFRIIPYKFAVSASLGDLVNTRTLTSLEPLWYEGIISSSLKIDANTVQFNCVIPPQSSLIPMPTKEVYLIAKDADDVDFLLGLCQPTVELVYDPEGELRIRIQFNLENVNIADLYEFQYTQALEIEDHNQDINAHPQIANTLKKHGIYFHSSQAKSVGQTVDAFPISGGNLLNRDVVYYNEVAAKYDKALADTASEKRFALGIYNYENNTVIFAGVFEYPHNEQPYTSLYLSDVVEGAITYTPSSVFIGYTLNNNKAILTINVTNDEDVVIDSDGDTELLLNPPVVRDLVLADSLGVKWEVLVSNEGALTTTLTTKRLSSTFRMVKPDLSSGHLEVEPDGTLYLEVPANIDYVIDDYYYLYSPNRNAWKLRVNQQNQVYTETHSNRYGITASPFNIFEVRQLISGLGTLGIPLVKLTDVLAVGQTVVGEGMSNFAFFDPQITGVEIKVPITFNELREWTSIGHSVGDVKESMLSEVNYLKIHGNTWVRMDGRNVSGSKYATLVGPTVPNVANKYIKIN